MVPAYGDYWKAWNQSLQFLVLRTCIREIHVSRVNEKGGYTDWNFDLFLVLELKIWTLHAKVVEITTMDSGDHGI